MGKKLLFFCFVFNLFGALYPAEQNDYLHIYKDTNGRFIGLDSSFVYLKWKLKAGDDSLWAAPEFNDSDWDTATCKLPIANYPDTFWSNIIWMRMTLMIDSSALSHPFGLLLEQTGASEIFLNGKLITQLGHPSLEDSLELRYDSPLKPIPVYFTVVGKNVLAIRYSNHEAISEKKWFNETYAGITDIKITDLDTAISFFFSRNVSLVFVVILIAAFIGATSFLHFCLYLFYRENKSNLYYSFFSGALSLMFISFIISEVIPFPIVKQVSTALLLFLLPVVFIGLQAVSYSLFLNRFPKWFKYYLALAFVCIAYYLLNIQEAFIAWFIIAVAAVMLTESVRGLIIALRKKKPGIMIIGSGILVFLAFIAILLVSMIVNNGLYLDDFLGIILLIFSFLSIPLSMSLYLARDFATTNKSLSFKLKEVQTLSEKNIEQEKEKKKILENQKELLELQVKEKTSEILIQKHELEEKNNEIVSSINYAKRLQEAILPPEKNINELLPENFILYQPKDIISGDFYWLSQLKEAILFAVADCTGHGVPGAMVSVVCSNALNRAVKEFGLTSPGEILNKTRELVIETFEKSSYNVNDGMDIALCKIVKTESAPMLYFSGANNPIWMVRNNEIIDFKPDKQPVGRFEHLNTFFTHQIPLTTNDVIYLFSDGFADQFGGPKGKKFKYSQLKELIVSIHQKPMHEQKNILKETMNKWMKESNCEQVDDICIMGVRF